MWGAWAIGDCRDSSVATLRSSSISFEKKFPVVLVLWWWFKGIGDGSELLEDIPGAGEFSCCVNYVILLLRA